MAIKLMTAFALLGLGASTYSTWVHYRILTDPTYVESVCDVSATVSCTAAYSSRFGSLAGVPVAVFGTLFFAFVLGLIAWSARSVVTRENLAGYVFAASTVGLAAVLYLGYAAYFILGVVCLACLTTYIAVIGLFITGGASTRYPMTTLPQRFAKDPGALTAGVLLAVAAAAAFVVVPEQRVTAAASEPVSSPVAEQQAAPPAPSAAQLDQLHAFLAEQPRVPVTVAADGAAVVIVKFNDYQCPACGQTYRDYKPVIAKWAREQPGKVKFVSKDYPLERQCNQFISQDLHPGACEAAVAVRLARDTGRAEAMEDWLFANQPGLTPETVRNAALTVGQVKNFDARFDSMLDLVKADIAQGAQLKITGTPTFFMNGMRLPGLRAEYFDAAIAWELRRVSGGQ
jgi:protein-disulfide isomerase/uncharacterized membrane protein